MGRHIYAWSKTGILITSKHLFTSGNRQFFLRKKYRPSNHVLYKPWSDRNRYFPWFKEFVTSGGAHSMSCNWRYWLVRHEILISAESRGAGPMPSHHWTMEEPSPQNYRDESKQIYICWGGVTYQQVPYQVFWPLIMIIQLYDVSTFHHIPYSGFDDYFW